MYVSALVNLIADSSVAPTGTFIHPSVYQVLDENPGIRDVSGRWSSIKALALFRHRVIPDEREIFWVHLSAAMKRKLEKIGILICGDAGVGKSTLINQVLKGNYVSILGKLEFIYQCRGSVSGQQ
jgi:ribosome biogenesis GTPase A